MTEYPLGSAPGSKGGWNWGAEEWKYRLHDDHDTDSVEEVRVAEKNDAGKPRYDLIPPGAIDAAARALTHGAEKYAAHDWEGMRFGRIFASVQRHLWEFWGNGPSNDDMDIESRIPTLGHALAALMMLYESWNESLGEDDRPQWRRAGGA